MCGVRVVCKQKKISKPTDIKVYYMYMVYRTCQIMFCFIPVEMFLYEKNMKNIKKMKLFLCFKAKVPI